MKVDIHGREGGGCVINLSGELDHHAAKQAISEIGGYLDITSPRRVVFDMKGVSFMDSSGVALVLHAYRRMLDTGGTVSLEHVPPTAVKIFTASGVTRIIDTNISAKR